MNLYAQIASNKRKTWLLMIGFVIFIAVIGYFIGEFWYGEPLFVAPLVMISMIINIGAYYFADKLALTMSGAKPINPQQDVEYYRLVENLSIASGLPMPQLYIIETPALNAFATGRDPQHAAVAVTRGLMQQLDKRELEAVLAHELSHIKNYDIRLMTVVVILVGIIAMIAEWGWRFGGSSNDRKKGGGVIIILGIALMILAPLVANLIKFAVSRQREYLADASAAYMTRHPQALARALAKISQNPSVPHASSATAHLFISNPFKGASSKVASLFSTHPPIQERIARLMSM